uniref:hypothetical protein n=1 Tax=Sulfuriferula sp. GW6 TaxID=3345112 RepID=UPI0039F6CBEF
MTPPNLTPLPEGAQLIAWHTSEDICAYRKDGKELFAMHGRAVTLDSHRWPSAFQLVIDLCKMDRAEFEDYATWLKSELFY